MPLALLLAAAGGTTASMPSAREFAKDTAKDTLYFFHSLRGGRARQEPRVNAGLGGRPLFPPDNPWNTRIDSDPADPRSPLLIQAIGADTPLHPDFGVDYHGRPFGMPYVVADRLTPRLPVDCDYGSESDPGPYPIPPDAPIEGGDDPDGDRHLLVIDRDEWKLYELFHAQPGVGCYIAGSGAVFDLDSNKVRPKGWTSADAAGLPILPGLVRYDEVFEQGVIAHALRFTAGRTRRGFIYPARHQAGATDNENYPPMGMRVRLKASCDISQFPKPAQVVLRALKTYGLILADNGGPWFISGTNDARWPYRAFDALKRIKGSDMEVVRMGPVER